MNRPVNQKIFFAVSVIGAFFAILSVFLGWKMVMQRKELADQKIKITSATAKLSTGEMDQAILFDRIRTLDAELNSKRQEPDALEIRPVIVEYALSPGEVLSQDGSTFTFIERDSMAREMLRQPLGTFQPPSALSYQRLKNGLFRFDGVADFLETGYEWHLYVNEQQHETKALVVSGGSESKIFQGEGMHLEFSNDVKGDLMAHIFSDTCDTNHRMSIDGMTWNGKNAVTFSPPITATCTEYGLGGNEISFFKNSEEVAPDLKTVAFSLFNGKRLIVKPVSYGVSVLLK